MYMQRGWAITSFVGNVVMRRKPQFMFCVSVRLWLHSDTQIQAPSFCTMRILKVKVKWSRYRPGVAQRMGRGIALLFHDRGTRRGWVVSSTPRPHFTSGKDPVSILQEAGWAPGPVWTDGKSRPHRDSIPDLQPVVCRYTDWATRPTPKDIRKLNVGAIWKFVKGTGLL